MNGSWDLRQIHSLSPSTLTRFCLSYGASFPSSLGTRVIRAPWAPNRLPALTPQILPLWPPPIHTPCPFSGLQQPPSHFSMPSEPSPQCQDELSKMQIWLDHSSALKPSIAPCAPKNKVQTPLPGVLGRKREKKKKWFARTFYKEQRKPEGSRMIHPKHWKKITIILETEWNFISRFMYPVKMSF